MNKEKINPIYIEGLTASDKKKQIKSIINKTDRPKLESYKYKRSKYVIAFEKKYDKKINDYEFIHDNIIKKQGIQQILNKGYGAYYSGGSRPNQNIFSWGIARLASVIMGGKALKVDKAIAIQYGLPSWKRDVGLKE